MNRKKILVLSDHPLLPSGVGIQTRYIIEGLLETERYKFVCFGGALKHLSMQPQMVAPDKYGDGNWVIYPVNGHGDKNMLRRFLAHEKPDAVLMVTDPRFFTWVWEMEDEVRSVCPLLYWHVWDNDPTPDFNSVFYNSTDYIGCISLKTYGILQDMEYPKEKFSYIPHALPSELFKPLPDSETNEFKFNHYGPHANKKFIVMWNNRNARRKQTGDVIATFAKFAKKVGHDNVALFMHTMVGDPEGQDIVAVAKTFGVDKSLIVSEQRVEPGVINKYYNVADVTINIASNEGFGLSTLESLYAGTPIIVHMTGGMQYQIGDWYDGLRDFSNQDKLTATARSRLSTNRWFGVPVFSASRSCTGSQEVPYIYDDRVCHDDVVDALVKLYEMSRKERKSLGLEGRKWALSQFSMKTMVDAWDTAITDTVRTFRHSGLRQAVV